MKRDIIVVPSLPIRGYHRPRGGGILIATLKKGDKMESGQRKRKLEGGGGGRRPKERGEV